MNKERLIKELDRVFSIVIRKMYADEHGFVNCATCQAPRRHWTELTCGHYRKRRHMKTRWMIKNAGPQCSECNVADKDMSYFIDAKFGYGTAKQIESMSHETANFSPEHIKELITEYTKML